MTVTEETVQAIHARILELLESGPVPQEELASAVAVLPDEREPVENWEQTVERVAKKMLSNDEIVLDKSDDPTTYKLPS